MYIFLDSVHIFIGPTRTCTILVYLLTPWSTVLLEKLTGSAASQEIPRALWNPKVHHRTHKCPPQNFYNNNIKCFLNVHLCILLSSLIIFNCIHQKIHTVRLETVCKFEISRTHFGSKTPTSVRLKYKAVQ